MKDKLSRILKTGTNPVLCTVTDCAAGYSLASALEGLLLHMRLAYVTWQSGFYWVAEVIVHNEPRV